MSNRLLVRTLIAVAGIWAVALGTGSLWAATPVNVDELLTVEDLQGYYGTSFGVSKINKSRDPALKDAPPVMEFFFNSIGPADTKRGGWLIIRRSASPEQARAACDAVRVQYAQSDIKCDEVKDLGDCAYWFGRQLNFSKDKFSFILRAAGLKEKRDTDEAHAAALVFAKKIVDRLP